MPSFPIANDLPFPPGESPFHVKGNVVRGFSEHFNRAVPGGVDAVIARLPTDALRVYLSQAFLSTEWYDTFAVAAYGEAAASLLGDSFQPIIRSIARAQAERDLHGVYSFLLHLSTPESLVKRLPRTAGQYFDFVSVQVRETAPRRWEISVGGIPKLLFPMHTAMTAEFLDRAFMLNGAKGFRTQLQAEMPDGERRGVPLVRYTRILTWE